MNFGNLKIQETAKKHGNNLIDFMLQVMSFVTGWFKCPHASSAPLVS